MIKIVAYVCLNSSCRQYGKLKAIGGRCPECDKRLTPHDAMLGTIMRELERRK